MAAPVPQNPFAQLFSSLQTATMELAPSVYAQRHFLNPRISHALRDDPDGSYHFKLQITDEFGKPLKNLKKGDPIPLMLRWYQREITDGKEKKQVLRLGRRCMLPGTPVLMADGSWKAIEEIRVGEKVIAYDLDTGGRAARTVLYEHDNGVKDVYEIVLSNGRSITCTTNHPLLTRARKWLSIELGLKAGVSVVVLNEAGDGWAEAEIQSITYAGQSQTYDIEVEWDHNFIANGIVCHNTGKSFTLGVKALTAALQIPHARVLILAPNESHIKILFDDYIRPLLTTYRHRKSGRIGIPNEPSGVVPPDCDFIVVTDTKKPQEIRIIDGKGHDATIRGHIVSTAARGQSATHLIFDEADYADTKKVQGIVGPIQMTSPDTKISMSSTPTGRRDSYFYTACHDATWVQYHHTYEVLPHFNEELRQDMIRSAGGEDTNTYQQEYLAEFGGSTEGVFDQRALNASLFVSPYVRVLEKIDYATRDRKPQLADVQTDVSNNRLAYYEAVQPVDYKPAGRSPGSESIYRPEYKGHGIITAGTDWNDVAGMQTVLIWWPPKEWLRDGRIKVARFQYDGDEPVVTNRQKDGRGEPVVYSVGLHNGPPGNPHDLSHVKGIVIWHGRLESGQFSWQAAANRVIGMLSIPDFINAWYVDYGYGEQVNKMIEGIMNSGQYIPDMNLLQRAMDIDDKMLRHIRRFHPENDPEQTGRVYRTVRFGDPYPFRDIDFKARDDRYKDVMVSVAKRMVYGREILFPYGELVGYYSNSELGMNWVEELAASGQIEHTASPEYDRDMIEPNGGDPARGERSFGGLVTQMREWRVESVTPTGRPKYAGADHAIDGWMLAVLAYWELFGEESAANIFKKSGDAPTALAEDNLSPQILSRNRREEEATTAHHGPFKSKHYQDEMTPVRLMREQGRRPEEVGTPLNERVRQAGLLARGLRRGT